MKLKTKSEAVAKLLDDVRQQFKKGGLSKADVIDRAMAGQRGIQRDDNIPADRVTAAEPSMKFYDPKEALNPLKIAGPQAGQKAYEAAIQIPSGSEELYQLESDADQRQHKEFQMLHDGLVFLKLKNRDYSIGRSTYYPRYKELRDQIVSKILTTGGTATGAEFVPDLLSGELVTRFRQMLKLASLMRHINMPKSPFTLPVAGADTISYLGAQATDELTGSHSADDFGQRTPATADVTLTAISLKVRSTLAAEAEEDSIIPMIPFIRDVLAEANANSIEDALLNADDTSTFQDTKDVAGNTIGATHHNRAWQGLRALALTSGNTFDMGNIALTAAAIMNVFKNFGKFAENPQDSLIVNSNIGNAYLLTDDKVKTVSELGNKATIVTGQIAEVYGIPIVLSGKMPSNLNASGVNDDSTTDRTGSVVFHRNSLAVGDRRAMTIKSAEDIITDKTLVVTTWRGDFKRINPEETTPVARNVGYIFNVSTTASIT